MVVVRINLENKRNKRSCPFFSFLFHVTPRSTHYLSTTTPSPRLFFKLQDGQHHATTPLLGGHAGLAFVEDGPRLHYTSIRNTILELHTYKKKTRKKGRKDDITHDDPPPPYITNSSIFDYDFPRDFLF